MVGRLLKGLRISGACELVCVCLSFFVLALGELFQSGKQSLSIPGAASALFLWSLPTRIFSLLSLQNFCSGDFECWCDPLAFCFSSLAFCWAFLVRRFFHTHCWSFHWKSFCFFLGWAVPVSGDVRFCVYLFCLPLLCLFSVVCFFCFFWSLFYFWAFLGDLWLSLDLNTDRKWGRPFPFSVVDLCIAQVTGGDAAVSLEPSRYGDP